MANRDTEVTPDLQADDLSSMSARLPDTDWCSFLMSTTYSSLHSKSVVTQDPTRRHTLSSATNPTNLPNASSTIKHMLWSLSFYAQSFDISTFITRCRQALLLPFLPHLPLFLDTLDGNPDLYGPFWITMTLVVILFLRGTISQYLASQQSKTFEYDLKLLSGGGDLVFGYTLFVDVSFK